MNLVIVNHKTNDVVEKVNQLLTDFVSPYRTTARIEKEGPAVVIRILKDLSITSSRMLYRRRIELNGNRSLELEALRRDLITIKQGKIA